MGQTQMVSWRTAGYSLLGSALAVGSFVAIVRSDGVRPTSLSSNAATRWLVDRPNKRVVLADGLAGHVVARIEIESEANDEVAVEGDGGAFLVTRSQSSVRTISTSTLQLGTAQTVAALTSTSEIGVGPSGLTLVDSTTDEASVLAVDDDTPRPIRVVPSTSSQVASDGSIWLLNNSSATHVNVDESSETRRRRGGSQDRIVTVGEHAVSFDDRTRTVHWLDGGDVPVASIANSADAVLQESGDAAGCVWLGAGNTLACIGQTGIDRTIDVAGMNLGPSDRLAIAGTAAALIRPDNSVRQIDLATGQMIQGDNPTPSPAADLTITAADDMIWIDDQRGSTAWAIHRLGYNVIDKADESAPTFDAQGQIVESGGVGQPGGDPGAEGDLNEPDRVDDNGREDPPVAVNDSVTARAGTTVNIPVTGNDYDPDGQAIAVLEVSTERRPGHGTADVLNGTSVAYVPETGFSGIDSFDYTIVDEAGNTATATVSLELFAADSPNQPPDAHDDTIKTRVGRAVTIDVLANDIDPERDMLAVSTFQQSRDSKATIVDDPKGPTGLPALRYQPPGTPGIYTFTYQANDPQGGLSKSATVTVDVSASTAENQPPEARPDAIRMKVNSSQTLAVMANDIDPDGDDLSITALPTPPGVGAVVRGDQLEITLLAGAAARSTVTYALKDGDPTHDQIGRVLVLKIGDNAPNRPPVANPDAERVVIGSSVRIPVTANDIDPDDDQIVLLSATSPADGTGTVAVEGAMVRFTPELPNITEPTTVTFGYTIGDGREHESVGTVTVTVLAEALPRAPFARDDPAQTVTDKPVTIDVLANDSDPNGGTPKLQGTPVCSAGGEAERAADDRVTFTPPPGQTGTFRCRYTVASSEGLEDEALIIVTVSTAPIGNRPPVFNDNFALITLDAGESRIIDAGVVASDSDNDALVFTFVGRPTVGSTDFGQKSQRFTYTAPSATSANKTPSSDAFEVGISDGHDGNIRQEISVRINDTNATSTIPIAREITRQAIVGDVLAIDALGEATVANNGAVLTLTAASLDSGPADPVQVRNGVVTVTTTGVGTVVISYTVADAGGLEASNKIRITVAEPDVGSPPSAGDDTLVVASGGVNSVDLLANDSGITDAGDRVSIRLLNPPAASLGQAVVNNGVLTFSAAPLAAFTASFQYSLTDGKGPASVGNIVVTVLTCTESPPSAQTANLFTPYQTPIDIDLAQYVSGTIRPGSINGAGLAGPSGRYTPPAGMNGVETVTYTVENGCRQSVEGVLSIDVNRPPVGGTVQRAASRGAAVTLGLADIASDDEPLRIDSLTGNPAWITTDGLGITAAPPLTAPSGAYTFTVTVADPGGLTASATITITITNLAPTAVADAYSTIITGNLYTLDRNPTANDSDPEGGPLCIQTIAWVDGGGDIFRFGPPDCPTDIGAVVGHGVSTMSYTVVDDGGLTAASTITITSNRPPQVQTPPTETTNHPTLQIRLDATDPDDDPIAVTCDPTPDFDVTVVNVVTLQIRVLTPAPPDYTASFPCTVTDSFGATATTTITIEVTD